MESVELEKPGKQALPYEPPGSCGWGLAGAEWHYIFIEEMGTLLSDGNVKLGAMWNFSVPAYEAYEPVDEIRGKEPKKYGSTHGQPDIHTVKEGERRLREVLGR